MKRPSSALRIAGAVAALLAGVACQNQNGPRLPPPSGEGAPPAPQIPKLEALAPVQSTAAHSGERAGTGSLQPVDQAALGPKETGVITAIAVDEGERVEKGQVLFRLDAATAHLAVVQAKAALSSAQVQLGTAQLDYGRTESLRERGSIPQDAFDQAKARFDATQSAVAQAEAALGLAQRRLSNMVVSSPIDGIVTEKRMNVGETATLMPPSIVLVVHNIDKLELRARLPETALRSVRAQSELEVSFPALEETRRVRVTRIAPTVDPRTRTIEIVAEIDNADHRLKAGMLVEVAFGKADDAAQARVAEQGVAAAVAAETAATDPSTRTRTRKRAGRDTAASAAADGAR